MARSFFAGLVLAGLALTMSAPAEAEFGLGADAASRYIWRGANLDDSFVLQPYLTYTCDMGLEIGAWSSWSLRAGGANENDIYISYSSGPISIALTDYYLSNAGSEFFDYDSDAAVHQLEAMGSYSMGPLSLTGAVIFHGDPDTPIYAEVGYEFMSDDDVSASILGGLGTEAYYTSDGDPALVNVALSVTKGDYTAQYILNPDAERTYLVLMKGL